MSGVEAAAEENRLGVWVHLAEFADEVAAVAVAAPKVDDRDVEVLKLPRASPSEAACPTTPSRPVV
jgi:hypothetical protein